MTNEQTTPTIHRAPGADEDSSYVAVWAETPQGEQVGIRRAFREGTTAEQIVVKLWDLERGGLIRAKFDAGLFGLAHAAQDMADRLREPPPTTRCAWQRSEQ